MIELRAGDLTTTWHPDTGMVCSSLRHRGEELLGQRGGLEDYRERGAAFGIPLLAPWANRLDAPELDGPDGPVTLDPAQVKVDGAGLPKDGLLAGVPWRVVEQAPERLVAEHDLTPSQERWFPFPHRLRVAVSLTGDALAVATTIEATGSVPVPVSFGWHPLFTLPGVPREALEVALPIGDELELDPRGIPTGRRVPAAWTDGPLGDRALDAEYVATGDAFVLRGGGRTLTVAFGAPGYPIGHAWAPAGEAFVAWEPMTAPTNALRSGDGLRRVGPGGALTATFVVRVTG
jgi:galactose mutarotase-like enzyme